MEESKKEFLPKIEDWPHRPIYITAGQGMTKTVENPKKPVPLGIPFEIDTALFKGKMLIRFRDAPSDDPAKNDAYFEGRQRVIMTVVQGQFKKEIPMDDLYIGCYFEHKLKNAPPPFLMSIMNMMFDRISPGLVLDLCSEKPTVSTLCAGTAQTMSVDRPGEEPDMTAVDIPENVELAFGDKFSSDARQRKKKLMNPKKAAKYSFETDKVYTFHCYDQAMNYGTYCIKLPMYGDCPLSNQLGPQAMTLSAKTGSGEIMYDFPVWHESVYRMKCGL